MGPQTANNEQLREDTVFAVILTDTFCKNFHPFTKENSLTLLPLVNTPLLDYSLDWLQRCEVDETIIYCNNVAHFEQVKNHARQWSLRYGNIMSLNVMSSENCMTLGDAMRDLYNKSILKNDFILMTGPVVGNIELRKIIRKFKMLKKKDPNGVMSCIYFKSDSYQGSQDASRIVNLITNGRTGKILSHNRISKSSKITLQTELLQSASRLKVLPQLEDPHLAICSPMVPPLFSDNFDYGTRDSLIQGIIEQEDLLGCSVYAHIMEEGYAACVTSFKAYEEISEAIIRRRLFPNIPERSLSSQRIRYLYQPFHGSYWDPSAKYHKRSLGDNVVIDAGTEIDPRCRMKSTVIGKHCVIKENVNVNNSFFLSNATINKGCILDTCFIGEGAKLLPGVHLEPGVVLGSGVVLGPNLKVNRCNRLQAYPPSGMEPENSNPLVCGNEGCAFVCEEFEPEEEEIHKTRWGEVREGEEEEEELKDVSEESSELSDAAEGEEATENVEVEDEVSSDEEREQEFEREVKDSLLNAYKNNSALENVILEVNSSRHAYNVTMENVLSTVTKAVLFVVEERGDNRLTGEKLWSSVKEGLNVFGELIKNYIKKVKDQMTILKVLEETANEEERLIPALQHILYEMNQELEILDDEVIIYWYSKKGFQTKAFPLIARSISKYILWLKQNEKEDDDGETDSEED